MAGAAVAHAARACAIGDGGQYGQIGDSLHGAAQPLAGTGVVLHQQH